MTGPVGPRRSTGARGAGPRPGGGVGLREDAAGLPTTPASGAVPEQPGPVSSSSPSGGVEGGARVPAPAPPPLIEATPAAPCPLRAAVDELVALAPDDPARPAARDRVVAAHLPLVEGLARRYTGRGEPYDDLVQVGTIGLLTAVDRFDPARGVPLGAYAVPHVLGEIRRHFRDRGWAVRVPRRLQEHGRTVADARAALVQRLGRAPTVAEIGRECSLDDEVVLAALESAGAYATVPLDDQPDRTTARWAATEDTALAGVEDRAVLRPLLDALPGRERRILALRFVRGMSQSEIAAEVGISQMHVSRLLTRTLAQLREHLAD
ncbi:SigB/SigF/SigG family RNA polymerase sigma factor [uncultured Pseudokineococcus sp.]|uniref:SigB/SigF/SigG family RNA polymerase sigma factor n=1 Tax=uncultured Pseudokineococcus sp. TaxID=1642928 RepID=UPI00262D5DAF|nr:SigB/SigF/SigG family RNA polymerase sigma factor [uncultured Pseudokineococcus sp.]